jgi:hypothetical protein
MVPRGGRNRGVEIARSLINPHVATKAVQIIRSVSGAVARTRNISRSSGRPN